jgi:hypothetical protein
MENIRRNALQMVEEGLLEYFRTIIEDLISLVRSSRNTSYLTNKTM